MKRISIFLLALALTAALAGSALGVGGTEDDPAVSLSYLEQVFTPELEAVWQRAVYGGLGGVYRDQLQTVTETAASVRLAAQEASASVPQRASGVLVLKQGDLLVALPGCRVTVKNGVLTAENDALVNITAGQAVATGGQLAAQTLYMAGGDAALEVQSATCEVTVSGVCRLDPSEATDYGSMAAALDAMGLFQGTGTGYVLESTANRAQGLVMFLRLLGLEDEALAYTGDCPFTDVPADHWARPYVAYAYQEGLTTGTSATAFSPDRAITCQHYLTFLLRALGYDEGTDFTYASALDDGTDLDLFSAEEIAALSAGTFYRYRMVYLSYYALFGVDQASGQLLMNRLTADGVLTQEALAEGLVTVAGRRIG